MSKYEKSINKVGMLLLNGEREKAEKLHKRLWPHLGDMTPVEIEVMGCHHNDLFPRKCWDFSEESYYLEGRCLERGESEWD